MAFTNLNKKIDQGATINRMPKRRGSRGKTLIKILLFLVILGLAIYLPVRGVYQSSKKLSAAAKGVSEAFKRENLDDVKSNLKQVQQANDDLNGSLNWLFWLRAIPYFGGFYADAKHFSTAASYELQATSTIVDSLLPYKAELGFNGQPSPGQDRVSQFVKILDKVVPQLDKVQPQLKKASDEIASVDTSKYPEKFGQITLRSRIETAKNFITGASFAVTNARSALEAAPGILGEPAAKNYLMIFQNDKELRGTGGFMTAYAFLKLDKGRVSSSTSDDIYRLDERLLNVCKSKICALTPPAPIVKYLPEADGKPRQAWSMRDSNLSPDVPTSMTQFERMYNMLGDSNKFDGIILIDTQVVETLIKITGPIEVFGTNYSDDFDKRCNCPNVIYELENYSQIIEKGEQNRKAILGTLMQQILARSLGASTDKLPEFINAGVTLANNKHIMVYMHDQQAQQALAGLNWTGQIKQTDGDYLHINDSNFAGGKSNLYVKEDVTLDVDTSSKRHKLTINYNNPQPYNIWLNAINRDYVRIYVPKGSKLISAKGSEQEVTTIDEELGKTVFEAFIQVRPTNSHALSFEYETPNSSNTLLIQKQSGTKDYPYVIKVNGSQKAKFDLNSDKEVKF